MTRGARLCWLMLAAVATPAALDGCRRATPPASPSPPAGVAAPGSGDGGARSGATPAARRVPRPPRPPRPALPPLGADAAYVFDDQGFAAKAVPIAEARAAGLLVVDLGDDWAPFIFQEQAAGAQEQAAGAQEQAAGAQEQAAGAQGAGGAGGAAADSKRGGYRGKFLDLANERTGPDGEELGPGEHNYLEPFGIPPTVSVLRARVEADLDPAREDCVAAVDADGLRALENNVSYLDRDRSRRDHAEALRDAAWLDREIAQREQAAAIAAAAPAIPAAPPTDAAAPATAPPDGGVAPATWTAGDRAAAIAALGADPSPKLRARVERTLRGQQRLRAVRAAQARLLCEGHLGTRGSGRSTPGMFDLATHEALAAWERKNDIFGWAFLGGETAAALTRPLLDLDFDTFRRVLAERLADAAGIVEDGSTAGWKRPPTYLPAGDSGEPVPVPNLIDDHVKALLGALHVAGADDMIDLLRQLGGQAPAPDGPRALRVAFRAPPLPPYYAPEMDLSAEIDRGDIWYDLPFDARGRSLEHQQQRQHFPHLTLYVTWKGQKIPLCRWRTTIGSWRSEMHANGKVYFKYKNSDVGPRVWKHIVAGPVWIPPDGTPAKDLLTRKVLSRTRGPELVVNTDVMGPGFQSAYGLVMAIHIDRRGVDNQIRTHGSVDYTSIARRFSHGCHRLVNDRAVRLFDFVLRHRAFRPLGAVPLNLKRRFVVDDHRYSYAITTRGTYFELVRPVPVTVTEGRIMGQVKKPIVTYVAKPGVDYSDVEDTASGDASASAAAIGGSTATATPRRATADHE